MDTKTLRELDKSYVWHPFTQMREWCEDDQLVIVRGEGSWLIDSDGNRWLDGVASIWTNVHGHCRREINEAVKAQVDRLEHSTQLGLANDQAAILAGRLVEIAPPGLSRVFYSDNGSTAMEVGIKMAFQYWRHLGKPERSRFITFRNAYHGDTVGCMSVGGIDIYHEVFRPLLFPAIQAPAPYCYRCALTAGKDKAGCERICLKELERLMEEHAAELAGVVIEPVVQGAGGMIVQPEGFVRRVRE
jgi:adenosylmethionine-8-amino-7-oxononanoate aminotransferase